MNTKKTVLITALTTVLGFATIGTQAAVLIVSDQLSITAGVATMSNSQIASFTGSYFAMDYTGDSKISDYEKNALSMGYAGIIVGATTLPGASHSGTPTGGDTNAITAPWSFFGNTGSDYVTTAITGSTTAGLDMSGWTVTWNSIAAIPMGTGAWQTATGTGHTGATGTFANGIGNFTWSGVYGTAYTLNYRATVPIGDASGFGGVQYELHLEGIASCPLDCDLNPPSVPVPAAAWLFGSGLLGLLRIARRKAG